MATTILQIITDALLDINAIEPGETPTDVLAQDALRRFTLMLKGWEADSLALTLPEDEDGVRAAYTVPDYALTDEWPLEDYFIEGLQAMLSIRLAAQYGETPDPMVRARAARGKNRFVAAFYPEPSLTNTDGLTRPQYGRGRFYV